MPVDWMFIGFMFRGAKFPSLVLRNLNHIWLNYHIIEPLHTGKIESNGFLYCFIVVEINEVSKTGLLLVSIKL